MKNTFYAFFSKWGNFNEIQLRTIPRILKGDNIILVSGTGSGKTRALVAPVVELLIRENERDDLFIYICPTKALVNDTFRRLTTPFEVLGLIIGRKTGDYYFNENLIQKAKGLIITLEGIDSLLTSRPMFFRRVRFVICDEVHLVDNTPRGDHLRILIRRIRKIREEYGKKINFYISSATIKNPKKLGNRYFSSSTLIQDNSKKNIELHSLEFSETIFLTLEKFMINKKLRKCIVFCNTRKRTEKLAKMAKGMLKCFTVYVHHASLSKKERESVEDSINSNSHVICFATMTLELGIDIGDIDMIVLDGVPPNVSSFLQRIGRGCRRRNDRSLVMCWFSSKFEYLLFDLYYKMAVKGDLDNSRYFPKYSVCIQQVFSISKQYYDKGFTKETIEELLAPLVSSFETQLILNHLIEDRYLFRKAQKFFPTTKLSDIIEKHVIYSNISLSLPYGDIEVRNLTNNDLIGHVGFNACVRGTKLLLGGKEWLVEKVGLNKIFVSRIKSGQEDKTFFPPKKVRGLLSLYMAQKIRETVSSSDKGQNHSKNFFIHKPVAKSRTTLVFHFIGTLYGFLLGELMKKSGICKDISLINGLYLVCRDLNILKMYQREYLDQRDFPLIESLFEIKSILNLGPYFEYLPGELQSKNLGKLLDFEEFWEILEQNHVELLHGKDLEHFNKLIF